MKQRTLLITAAGGAGPIAIIKSLKDKYRIVATDMNKYAVGLYLAHKEYISPLVESSEYKKLFKKIVVEENVDFIIPSIDEELVWVSTYLREKQNIFGIIPSKEFITLCLDKLQLMKKLTENKIACPKTFLMTDFEYSSGISFPCVVKPRVGRGSRGFAVIKSKEELKTYLATSKYNQEEILVQELLEGVEFTVSAVVTKSGKVFSVIPKEIIKKQGITYVAVTRINNEIEKLINGIQAKFMANGPFNVQLIISQKTGVPTVFEINPRLSTTVALDIVAGVNSVDLLISDILSLPFGKPRYKNNLVMTRYYDQYYFEENKIK